MFVTTRTLRALPKAENAKPRLIEVQVAAK